MTCYAMACRREHPCASDRLCERNWHACTPPEPGSVYWTCWCRATWTYHIGDGRWVRNPLQKLTGVS